MSKKLDQKSPVVKSNFHPSPRCRFAQSSQTSSLVSTPSAGTRCQSAPNLTSSYLTSAQTREPRELHLLTLPPGRLLVIINLEIVESLSSVHIRLASRSLGFSRGGLDAPRLDRKLLYSRSGTQQSSSKAVNP